MGGLVASIACDRLREDQAEARKSFTVEADIFFEETVKRGTLEKLLMEYGCAE
ncbi:MAG: hypothetical protein M3R08_05790 [Bacteroidota bacterium]|nr:hypothetical protein [Bacteroidota bacterium]